MIANEVKENVADSQVVNSSEKFESLSYSLQCIID